MPYYNGAWLTDEEYEAVAAAMRGDDGTNGLTPPRAQPMTGLDPRWSQPNSGQEAVDHYGGGADRGVVQPYRPAVAQPTARPTTTAAAGGGQPARPDNQRPGETYQQYLTRFYAAYGQQPPAATAPATPQPRPQGGGGGGGGPSQQRPMQTAYVPPTPPRGWDEAAYLRANPDVAAALRRGGAGVSSGYEHYINHGIGERRLTAPTLNGMSEQEYLARNPDVAAAVGRGQFASAWDHWNQFGRNEVRAGGRGLNAFEQANPWAMGMTADAVRAAQQAAQQRPATPAGPTPEQQRAAQVAGIKPRITGVDRWGAQIVGFDNVPAGLTLTNDELGRMAANAGFGAAAVQQGWRDRGGRVGAAQDAPSTGGVLGVGATQPATQPTTQRSAWDAPQVAVDGLGKNLDTVNPEIWGTGQPKTQNDIEFFKGPANGNSNAISKAPKPDHFTDGVTPVMASQGGYDWGNPQPSEADKALFGNGGLPPEEDDEEKFPKW